MPHIRSHNRKINNKRDEEFEKRIAKMEAKRFVDWTFFSGTYNHYDKFIGNYYQANGEDKEDIITQIVGDIMIDRGKDLSDIVLQQIVDDLKKHYDRRYPQLTDTDNKNLSIINEEVLKRTHYGMREELVEVPSTRLIWANSAESWLSVGNVRKGEIITLDANEAIVPLREKEVERVLSRAEYLPLYQYSFEAKKRGQVNNEEATKGWALLQLEKLRREKGT